MIFGTRRANAARTILMQVCRSLHTKELSCLTPRTRLSSGSGNASEQMEFSGGAHHRCS